MSLDQIARWKSMDRTEIENLCISYGMAEYTAKTKPKLRLVQYLTEVSASELDQSNEASESISPNNSHDEYQALLQNQHEDESDDNKYGHSNNNTNFNYLNNPKSEKSHKTQTNIKIATSPSDFIERIQNEFDALRNDYLQHPKLIGILSQQQELLQIMRQVEELQNSTITDLLDDLCFDDEDRKYFPLQETSFSRQLQNSKENPLLQLCSLQTQIVQRLEYIISRRTLKFKEANININEDKDLMLKSQALEKLFSVENKKRQFIENTILYNCFVHPLFVEAKQQQQQRLKSKFAR